eukprot:12166-Heterococcus_DN1.PRE.2
MKSVSYIVELRSCRVSLYYEHIDSRKSKPVASGDGVKLSLIQLTPVCHTRLRYQKTELHLDNSLLTVASTATCSVFSQPAAFLEVEGAAV